MSNLMFLLLISLFSSRIWRIWMKIKTWRTEATAVYLTPWIHFLVLNLHRAANRLEAARARAQWTIAFGEATAADSLDRMSTPVTLKIEAFPVRKVKAVIISMDHKILNNFMKIVCRECLYLNLQPGRIKLGVSFVYIFIAILPYSAHG